MDTILHTAEGAVPVHTAIEKDMERRESREDWALLWEAARLIVNGVNARPGNESLKEVKP